MSAALVLRGASGVSVDIVPAATEQRDSAVAFAATILAVTTPEEAKAAVEVVKDLRAIAKTTEDSRQEIKRPVLDLGKTIDTVAKGFLAPVDAEISRVGRLLTSYQAEQERQRQEAERARQEAIRKAQEEEARAKQAAEEARRKAEAEAAAAAAKAQEEADPFALAEAQAAQAMAAHKEAQAKLEAEEAARAATTAATVATAQAIAPAAPAGLQFRRQPDFEITDARKLAGMRPDLVAIIPKTREILAELRSKPEWVGRREVIPGVSAWWEGKAVVR